MRIAAARDRLLRTGPPGAARGAGLRAYFGGTAGPFLPSLPCGAGTFGAWPLTRRGNISPSYSDGCCTKHGGAALGEFGPKPLLGSVGSGSIGFVTCPLEGLQSKLSVTPSAGARM